MIKNAGISIDSVQPPLDDLNQQLWKLPLEVHHNKPKMMTTVERFDCVQDGECTYAGQGTNNISQDKNKGQSKNSKNILNTRFLKLFFK